MRVAIRVKPRASRPGIERAADGTLVVSVHEAPDAGRANAAVVEALAAHFGVAKRRVRIVRGLTSRGKLVEIEA